MRDPANVAVNCMKLQEYQGGQMKHSYALLSSLISYWVSSGGHHIF